MGHAIAAQDVVRGVDMCAPLWAALRAHGEARHHQSTRHGIHDARVELDRVAAPAGQTTPFSVDDLQFLVRATRGDATFMAVTLLAAAFTHIFRAQSTLSIAPHHVQAYSDRTASSA